MKRGAVAFVVLILTMVTWRVVAAESDPQSHFTQLDGLKIHYTARGTGSDALVFVHGWNCDLRFWKRQVGAFRGRVIAIDLPGHGESEKPLISYTMDLHARAIEAVLRDAKVQHATLIGHSNGTPVIRQFYRLFPGKTRALVIVDGTLRPFAEPAEMEKFIGPMRGPDYRDYIGHLVDAMLRPMKNETDRAEIKAAMLETPQHVAVSEMEAILKPEIWGTEKIEVPVLMILAKQPAWTAEYEKFVRGLVPDLDYQMWEGVSHFLMIDKPNEFNAAVDAFLMKHHVLLNDAVIPSGA